MPAKFLFERIFQLLAFSPHQIVPTRTSLDPKKFLSLPPLPPNTRRRLFSPSSVFSLCRDAYPSYWSAAEMKITVARDTWTGRGGERRWPLIALRRERGEEEGEEEEGVGGGESRQLLRQRCCGIGGGLPGSAGGSPGGNTRTILWDPLARYRPLTHASTDGPRPES